MYSNLTFNDCMQCPASQSQCCELFHVFQLLRCGIWRLVSFDLVIEITFFFYNEFKSKSTLNITPVLFLKQFKTCLVKGWLFCDIRVGFKMCVTFVHLIRMINLCLLNLIISVALSIALLILNGLMLTWIIIQLLKYHLKLQNQSLIITKDICIQTHCITCLRGKIVSLSIIFHPKNWEVFIDKLKRAKN